MRLWSAIADWQHRITFTAVIAHRNSTMLCQPQHHSVDYRQKCLLKDAIDCDHRNVTSHFEQLKLFVALFYTLVIEKKLARLGIACSLLATRWLIGTQQIWCTDEQRYELSDTAQQGVDRLLCRDVFLLANVARRAGRKPNHRRRRGRVSEWQ